MRLPMHKPLLALAAALLATAANADTLVTNVNGIQVDANGKVERFTGILIGNDGKVKHVLHGEMLKLARHRCRRCAGTHRSFPA